MTAPADAPGPAGAGRPDRGRLVAGTFAAGVLVLLGVVLIWLLLRPEADGSAAPPMPAVTATPTPSTPTEPADPTEVPAITEAPTAAPSEPVELSTGDLEPGTTAIFRGEPATGPWQTIGSVREITADGAGPIAADAYTMFWEEEGLPDDLWDRLVADVSLQATELGPPLNRPFLDAAAGSEVFNARGGVRWTNSDTEGRGTLVAFDAIYDREGLGVWPRWAFLLHPETNEVLATHPRIEVSEDDVERFEDATDQLSAQLWEWVLTRPVITEP